MKKVIMIMSFSTKAEEYQNQPRPEFCWTNPRGEILGIWDKEFSDIMLMRLVNVYPEYDCEIWQPELRADKLYTAQLRERLAHKKFPAVTRRECKRGKTALNVHSEPILNSVREHDNEQTVFMLPAAVYSRWLNDIIKSIRHANILYYNLLNNGVLLPISIKTVNPIKAVNRILINLEKKQWLKRVSALLTPETNPQALAWLRKNYPDMQIYSLEWGLNQEFWQAIMTREEARAKLDLAADQYVILLSQRLVPEYQVDHFIEVVASIRPARKFRCIITGHGSVDYSDHLQKLIKEHKLTDKVKLTGFISDEILRTYQIAADLFATFPLMSAGSGGALKAMAVGTPVLLTTTCGESHQFLREHHAGVYVEPSDYEGWARILSQLIDGQQVGTVSRETVLGSYNSRKTADSIHKALQHWN